MDRQEIEALMAERLDAWKRELREEVRKMTTHALEHVDDVLSREAKRWATETAEQHALNAETRRTLDEQKHEQQLTLKAAQRILDGTVGHAVGKALEPLAPQLEASRKALEEFTRLREREAGAREERDKQKAEHEAELRKRQVERDHFVKVAAVVASVATAILAAFGAYAGMRAKVAAAPAGR